MRPFRHSYLICVGDYFNEVASLRQFLLGKIFGCKPVGPDKESGILAQGTVSIEYIY